MATEQEIQKKFKQLGVNRAVTKDDVANVNKYGISILDKTFGNNQGVSTNQPAAKTPGQAGQQANSQAVAEQETGAPMTELMYDQGKSAEENLETLTSQGAVVSQIIEKGLQAKQQAEPYDEKIAKAKRRIGRISLDDYSGMPMQDALRLMNNDIADFNARAGYFESKKQEAIESGNAMIGDFKELLNSQLQALGLRVEDERDRRNFEEQQRQFNAQMAARGGGGGGGSRKDPESAFRTSAADAILALDSGQLEWATAWDVLKTSFPEKSNEEIDAALGGSYGEGGPTGRAESTFGVGQTETDIDAQVNELQTYINLGQIMADKVFQDPDVPQAVKAKLKPPSS